MESTKVIGVVGGVGPYAGIDLVRKIFDQTVARRDQEHLPVLLMSLPEEIEDRTAFLLGRSSRNPAHALVEVLRKLSQAGATVAGIPCNTAHAPAIFDLVKEGIAARSPSLKLLHMIEETAEFLQQHFPQYKHLGLLSTIGTAQSGVYQQTLERTGFRVMLPDEDVQRNQVHSAIYDAEYGIKAVSNPVAPRARQHLLDAAHKLLRAGAEAIILGCTEIPLALPEQSLDGVPLIDPTTILARALIREVRPHQLKPLPVASVPSHR
jgi:aspartate racemase